MDIFIYVCRIYTYQYFNIAYLSDAHIMELTSIPCSVRLSGLESAYSHPNFSAGDCDS